MNSSETTKELGIEVFPSSWEDLDMHCSCPDWAVPCKHLAAVIYLLTREIDNDPFQVFRLRGLDLIQALASHDVHIEPAAGMTLPALEDLLRQDADIFQDAAPAEPAQPDFSAIPALLDPLIRILPAQPACFAQGDLRSLYQRVLARCAKQARRVLDTAPGTTRDPVADQALADGRPHIEIDDAHGPTLSGCAGLRGWHELESALEALEPSRLPDVQPEWAALHHARLLALHLLAAGALTAQVFTIGDRDIGLRWRPALLDPAVRDQVRRVAREFPAGLLGHRAKPRGGELPPDAQAVVLCSLFLGDFVRRWGGGEHEKPPGDKTLALFFVTGRARFDGPGEGAVAGGIQGWLAHHQLAHHAHRPVLCLEEAARGDFSMSVAIEADVDAAVPVPLSRVLADPAWARDRFGVLRDISMLAEFFPRLHAYVREEARAPILLSAQELPELLRDTLPVIRLLGLRTLMPKALERLLRPRLSLRVSSKKAAGSSGLLDTGSLFSFDWRVAVGEHLLTGSQFEKLVGNATGVIRFKGEYVYLDPGEIDHLRAQLDRPPRLEGAAGLRIALAGEYAGSPVGLDAQTRRHIQALTRQSDIALPKGIDARLRPYQQSGYAWLYRNTRIGLGSVIADDMGLGKTLQVITTLQKLKEDDPQGRLQALVVVPTSLLANWQKEIGRFAPGLSVDLFHGGKRAWPESRPDVLLTSYGVARRDAAALGAQSWRVLVVDEAQNIKNPAAAQTRAIKSIPAQCFIAMSGTPVENHLSEYWSIMDFANRGYLGSLAGFTRDYAIPIQTHRDPQVIERFRRVTEPFLLRRLKSDRRIIDDLPDKIEQDQYCTLTPAQAALYESVVREGLQVIHGESHSFRRQGLVLQMILALKQVCNHPAQYLKQGKTEAALSGKAERLLDLVDAIQAGHEKVLVFTQFREMGELLSTWIHERYGRAPQFLHGGVARTRRDAMVERFQHDRTERVFILSLKAGGTGLNLTAANHVIHYDLWWNPAVEAQATDRAYRIGQHSNVQVHRLLMRDTFEERINDLIRSKRELAELAVGVGEKWIGNLDEAQMAALFARSGHPA